MTQAESRQRFLTILCFALVYFFWGSTYLGIRIAIEHIPPALMCGTRFLVAGGILLVYCKLKGEQIFSNADQLIKIAIVGLLLLMGGNLMVAYAEQYLSS